MLLHFKIKVYFFILEIFANHHDHRINLKDDVQNYSRKKR